MWLETEGGDTVAITAAAVEDCASDIAGLISQGGAMQEVEDDEVEVLREVSGLEIKDIIMVRGSKNRKEFTTPRKNKVKTGEREVLPSPIGKRKKTQPGHILAGLQE